MKNPEKNIELEFWAMFDEVKYKELEKYLDSVAEDLGEDDKNVYFFILPGKLLKVSDNISKKTAKISLKLEKIGRGNAFKENEFLINQADVLKAVDLFKEIGCDHVIESFQKRHNYLYEGVELALKYSKDWGYHLELEIMIAQEEERAAAEVAIRSVAQKLGLILMTNEELLEFTKQFEKK